jgi:hypothetical protein
MRGVGGHGIKNHGVGRECTEDETFEKGVGCETIGSVDSGARGFPGGVESGERGVAVYVGEDASHKVVGGRPDGDEVPVEFEVVLREELRYAGKAGLEILTDVAHIEVDRAIHALTGDRSSDYVSRGELQKGMVALHEALAVRVDEVCAFAAEGLAEEKAGCSGLREGGGVELVELHIGDGGSGAVGHGDTVAGGDGRIGGVGVDLTGSSAGEERGAGMNVEDASFAIEKRGSDDVAVEGKEIDACGPFHKADVWEGAYVAKERDGDLAAGGITVGVEDARAGVCALAGEHQFAVLAIEGGTPGEEFFYAAGALFDENAGGFWVDEAVACGEGVFVVKGHVFVTSDSDGDSALCVSGVGLGELFLGDDEDGTCPGEADGRAESGDSGSDDEEVDVL